MTKEPFDREWVGLCRVEQSGEGMAAPVGCGLRYAEQGGYLAKMFAVSFAGDVLAGFVADDGIPALVQPPHEIRTDFWVDRYDSVLARFGLETPLQVSAIL